jgi:hypothetical protein
MPYRVTEIDAQFPVAGIDNESQGFRDNFASIKDSLAQAKTDIESLQGTTLSRTEGGNLNGNTISNVNLGNVSYDSFDLTGVNNNDSEGQPIDFSNGPYQSFALNKAGTSSSNPQVLRFDNWPEAGRYGPLRVQITSQLGSTQYFEFVYPSGLNFLYDEAWPRDGMDIETILSVDSTDAKIFEFWTFDGGVNIYARYLGQFTLVAS